MRKLEIGPGKKRLKGFETFDIIKRPGVDYVGDARSLPFEDGTFSFVYASHVIEHFPWYATVEVLSEWRRVLAPGGSLDVWTVDAAKVARLLLEYEDSRKWERPDKWSRHGVDSNPYQWCNGRIFAYARQDGDDSVNWHRAMFTPRHLCECFEAAGFNRYTISRLNSGDVKGKDHGFVNLGVRGVRPRV